MNATILQTGAVEPCSYRECQNDGTMSITGMAFCPDHYDQECADEVDAERLAQHEHDVLAAAEEDSKVVLIDLDTKEEHKTLRMIDWAALFAHEQEDQEWIVPHLIPVGRQAAIFSAAGAGKSLLMLEAAAAVATGREILGEKTGQCQHVLYIDQEMTPSDIQDRMLAFGYGPQDAPKLQEFFHYSQTQDFDGLDTELGGKELLLVVDRFKPVLVVVDTMTNLIRGKENDADTFRSFDHHVSVGLKHRGIALVRLDHEGKDPSLGARGSSAKSGYVDLVWHLVADTKKHPTVVNLKCDKSRLSTVTKGDTVKLVRLADDEGLLHHDAVLDADVITDAVEAVIKLLDAAGVPVDESVKKAQEKVKKAQETVRLAQKERRRRIRQPDVPAVKSGSIGASLTVVKQAGFMKD